MYLCVKVIDISSSYDFSIRLGNCPGSVLFFCFYLLGIISCSRFVLNNCDNKNGAVDSYTSD